MERSPTLGTPVSADSKTSLLSPISPPLRKSSLAFRSSTPVSPSAGQGLQNGKFGERPMEMLRSSVLTNALISPLRQEVSPAACVSPDLVIMRAVTVKLRQDLFASSSPASSIESRMHLEQRKTPWFDKISTFDTSKKRPFRSTTPWRYSTAPQNLATAYVDVREPLPSPTLPDIPSALKRSIQASVAVEPLSSGFTSPDVPLRCLHTELEVQMRQETDTSHCLGGSPFSTNRKSDLERSLDDLSLSLSRKSSNLNTKSPIISHPRHPAAGGSIELQIESPHQMAIYLSETAKAAAESAKAKRKLLRNTLLDTTQYNPAHHPQSIISSPLDHLEVGVSSPQSQSASEHLMTPCPDPLVHLVNPAMTRRPISATSLDTVMDHEGSGFSRAISNVPVPRATADGSPMPFTRTGTRLQTIQSDHYELIPGSVRYQRNIRMAQDHLRSDVRYDRDTLQSHSHSAYAFSTAASKVVGSNQAPDSRIRDSYKTDTLTALAKPPIRYRRNGIGAEVVPRGVGRYYERSQIPPRSYNNAARPDGRQVYHATENIRFRSSPPRAPTPERLGISSRKRSMDDSYITPEDFPPTKRWVRPKATEAIVEDLCSSSQRGTAVRTSVFGLNTPQASYQSRQGIQELSPNIQVSQNASENSYIRKKPRSSYWDKDLKRLRESPAARRGVNSPVSAQASMQAEFETVSTGEAEMDLDDLES